MGGHLYPFGCHGGWRWNTCFFVPYKRRETQQMRNVEVVYQDVSSTYIVHFVQLLVGVKPISPSWPYLPAKITPQLLQQPYLPSSNHALPWTWWNHRCCWWNRKCLAFTNTPNKHMFWGWTCQNCFTMANLLKLHKIISPISLSSLLVEWIGLSWGQSLKFVSQFFCKKLK